MLCTVLVQDILDQMLKGLVCTPLYNSKLAFPVKELVEYVCLSIHLVGNLESSVT